MVVGADAVGVACLSGPVLAAAVIMPAYGRRIPGVRDSKMLSRAQRERLYPKIMRGALAVGLGAASVAEIDRINIYHATNLAMRRAICRMGERQHVLIDGLRVHRLEDFVGSYTAVVHGDARCYSIAAASIVAKVVRDRLMDTPRGPLSALRLGAQRRIRDLHPPPRHRGAAASPRSIGAHSPACARSPSESSWSWSCRPENLDALFVPEYAAVSEG